MATSSTPGPEHSHIRVKDLVLVARSILQVQAGDEVKLTIGPAATCIAANPRGGEPTNVLHGNVEHAAYRGRGYDHVIAAGPRT